MAQWLQTPIAFAERQIPSQLSHDAAHPLGINFCSQESYALY